MKNIKALLIAVILFAYAVITNAQSVGINSDGSAPNGSAMLDVRAANKGLLIPNIALTGTTDAATITTPAVSLLVYNTATISNVTPGYYYNSGTTSSPVWARLLITNANLTGAVSSTGNATSLGSFSSANLSGAVTDETGTGAAVFASSPTLVTPVLGVATATSINGLSPTAAATGFTIAGGNASKTLIVPLDASVSGTNTGDNAVNTTYSGLTNYTHPSGDGNLHVISTSTSNSGKVLTAGATAGSLSWTSPAAGTVTSVTATSPIVSSGGDTPAISLGTVPIVNGGTGTTNGSITGTGALTFAAGGSNQNVTITPSGTGKTILNGNIGIGTSTPADKIEIVDASTQENSISITKTGSRDISRGLNSLVSGGTTWSQGLISTANGTGANNVGVYSVADGAATSANYGVRATANSGGTNNYGIFAQTSGSAGTASNFGGYFDNSATNGTKYGVYGTTTGSSSGNNYGGQFSANGSTGNNFGAYGAVGGGNGANNYGGFFQSTVTGGTLNYAVYGKSIGVTTGTNIGGYFTALGSSTANYGLIVDNGNVGIGTTTPDASAIVEVNSSSKGFLPPRMTAAQRVAIASPVAGLLVYQTDGSLGLYHYNGSAWSILNSSSPTYTTGSNADLGGYVFFVTPDGKHGLVAETQDQTASINWYNAQAIVSDPANHSTAGKNFTDWHMPTIYELGLMYVNRVAITGFSYTSNYWSSSHWDSSNAHYRNFSTGGETGVLMTSNCAVRAIRSF